MIYTEIEIKDQIKAGGLNDWRLYIGRCVVSVRYIETPRMLRRAKKELAVIVFAPTNGSLTAICRILIPANKISSIHTDNKTYLRAIGSKNGRLCAFDFDEKKGPYFSGGRWLKTTGATLEEWEKEAGVTDSAELWECVNIRA